MYFFSPTYEPHTPAIALRVSDCPIHIRLGI
jgi:hypothetical protein